MAWNEYASEGGGGYFNEDDFSTPSGKGGAKSAVRQQFLCPVTIRQVLESPEEGLKIGNFTATMVTLAGVVVSIDCGITQIKFNLSDDTGVIECVEWIDSDEGESKKQTNLIEKLYYQVYGSIKILQGRRRIMVFKVVPISTLNEYTAFMAEVINVNHYAEKMNQMPVETVDNDFSCYNNYKSSANDDHRTAFNPVQRAVLEAIKAVEGQIGWSKNDPELRKKFTTKHIEDALDFLISEGHIYSTIDDDHYCST